MEDINKYMNIIYFHTHDMGRMCAPYGHKIDTPNMQRFAEESVVFRQAFCIAPTCSPSRAALTTGQYPHQNGMYGLAGSSPWRLNDYGKHISRFFKNQGYDTALAGLHHEDGFPPDNLSYDRIMNMELMSGLKDKTFNRFVTTDLALDYLKERQDNKGKPFFLAIGYDTNHRHRWDETCAYLEKTCGKPDPRYITPPVHLPNTPEARAEVANYYQAIRYVDMQLGRVMQALTETGLDRDTLIFFTTDHGIGLPYMKKNLTDGGCGVALMLRLPDGTGRGGVVDALVTHMDIYPTLCELIGAKIPDWAEGRSLMPLINGEADRIHDEIFLEQSYHGSYAPLRAVRTERYKYVRRYGEESSRAYFNTDGGEIFKFLIKHGYDKLEIPEEQLFDLYFDTQESCNVIGNSNYTKIADELRLKLKNWQVRTSDPILTDSVPLPPNNKNGR